MNNLRGCWKNDSGQVVVVTALCMVILLAFLGMAIDVGHLRMARQQMQTLADAAAMAGGLEIRVCALASTAPVSSCDAMNAAVKNAIVENGQTATFLTNCATPGAELTVTLNNGPCASSTDPNKNNNRYVEAVVSEQVRTYFARVVGYDHVKVSARAEAKRGVDPCIWALNPHIGSAITAIAALGLNSTCGIVDESDSNTALSCLIGLVSAPKINVTGKVGSLLCGSAAPITTGAIVPTPADPMAYLPVPPTASAACPSTNGTFNVFTGVTTYTGSKNGVNAILGSFVFNPGVYCGGINLTAALASTITFNPGIYILRDGTTILNIPQGGLNITLPLLASITGNGVMFYNQGNVTTPSSSVGSLSITAPLPLVNALNLSAPTSGTYGGVLFWQAKGVATSGTYLANLLGGGKFEGAIYQPSAKVAYAVGLLTTSYNILVADQINFTGQILSTVGSNYAALANGSPLHGDTAVLIQ